MMQPFNGSLRGNFSIEVGTGAFKQAVKAFAWYSMWSDCKITNSVWSVCARVFFFRRTNSISDFAKNKRIEYSHMLCAAWKNIYITKAQTKNVQTCTGLSLIPFAFLCTCVNLFNKNLFAYTSADAHASKFFFTNDKMYAQYVCAVFLWRFSWFLYSKLQRCHFVFLPMFIVLVCELFFLESPNIHKAIFLKRKHWRFFPLSPHSGFFVFCFTDDHINSK